jgi:hypothetical protein
MENEYGILDMGYEWIWDLRNLKAKKKNEK